MKFYKLILLVLLLLGAGTSFSQVPGYVPTDSLLGWYPFNGNANNEYHTGKNGTVMGPVLTTDRFGMANSAYYFNGHADHIVIDTTYFNVGWSEYSISGWFVTDSIDNPFTPSNNQAIFNTIPHNGIELGHNWGHSGKNTFFVNQNPTTIYSWNILGGALSVAPVAAHVWRHIVFVKRADTSYSVYLNGVLDVTYAPSLIAINYYCKTWFGNIDSTYAPEGFWGKLDDFGLWRRALTPCEIWNLYIAGIGPHAGTITGPSTVCVGATITLTDTSSGGVWSSAIGHAIVGSGTGIVTGLSPGIDTIKYTVTAACGTLVATKIVTVTPGTTPITGLLVVCAGSATTLNCTPSGGIWSSGSPGIASVGSVTGVVTGLTAGIASITYTSTPGCASIAVITVNPLPVAGTLSGLSTLCVTGTINIVPGVAGGIWSSTNTNATVSPSGVVTGVILGVDTIKYSVTNSCGTAIAIKVVTVSAGLPDSGAINGPGGVCVGQTITLTETVSGGKWHSSSPGIATIDSMSGLVSGVTVGVVTITYAVTNICGTAFATKQVTVNPLPSPGLIAGLRAVCVGATTIFTDTVTGGKWSSSNIAVATIDSVTGTITAFSPGTTTITYYTAPNAFGCTNKTTFPFTVLSQAPFHMANVTSGVNCSGESTGSIFVTITGGTGNYTYLWSTGAVDADVSNLSAGTYTLHVKDQITKCVADYSFIINEPDTLGIVADVKNDFCKNGKGSISIIVKGGTKPYHCNWTDNKTGTDLEGLHSGTYVVTVTDSNGCVKMDSITVKDDTCKDIVIHDVITPNGDGINDVWVIEDLQKYPDNSVQVFDKWGDLVFERKGYNNDWYGRGSKGELLPDGTYYYLVKLNAGNVFGGNNVFMGTLLIKR